MDICIRNIPTLSRIQRWYYSFNLPSFENYIYSHQSIASFLACAFMYAYLNRHIVIGIIAYGLPVGLDLDIRALSSKQHLASETLERGDLLCLRSWFALSSEFAFPHITEELYGYAQQAFFKWPASSSKPATPPLYQILKNSNQCSTHHRRRR